MTTPLLTKTGRMATIVTLLFTFQSFKSQKEKDTMKIKENQTAPDFTLQDVNGNTIHLSDYKGKKVLLSFFRNVGCPVCNVRFHELQEKSDYFRSKNLILLAVYESSAENMKKYLDGENPYAVMIPNPDESLYKRYAVDKSMGKVMKGMFRGAMSKMKKGKKLFKSDIKQDGNATRIGADFLIDEKGVVKNAYYGDYVGDHLPLAEILSFIQ